MGAIWCDSERKVARQSQWQSACAAALAGAVRAIDRRRSRCARAYAERARQQQSSALPNLVTGRVRTKM